MNILFLAPQPFYQERGTPIAVRLALETLAQDRSLLGESGEIHVVTYKEGEDLSIPNVTIDRIWSPKWLQGIGPGISWRKLGCDIIFGLKTFKLLCQKRFTVIHAVEESVFIAALAKIFFRVPYIYDMDSSLSLQLTDQWGMLRPLRWIFESLERFVIKGSIAVAPVCDALHELASRHGAAKSVMLRDVSLLSEETDAPTSLEIRSELGIEAAAPLVMYVGNLEPYQGVKLLIQSFAQVASEFPKAHLAIIGGREHHRLELLDQLKILGLGQDRVTLLGPRPVRHLRSYLLAADILASPRTQGNNTPMKIYSYLHAGKAIIATRLPTHTQVLDDSISQLVESSVEDFARGLRTLLSDLSHTEQLGRDALKRAETHYTVDAFKRQLRELYKSVHPVDSTNSARRNDGTTPTTAELL